MTKRSISTSSSNFFVGEFLTKDRASLNYKNFIETISYFSELYPGSDVTSAFDMPYPVFYDLVIFKMNQKKKEAERERRKNTQAMNSTSRTPLPF
jgi:hypothetical protein